ncbi:MAG: pyrroloquinoline quinone biosynthesis protein PqqB [Bacteroidetes bacterium]|nr:pyrroloquinoline quinone biosynthesis protein PqqB [Bacteroidota bacterium]
MHRFVHLVFLLATVAQAQSVYVLGTAQDGGYPHIGCSRTCCRLALDSNRHESVVALAVADTVRHQWWLVEATPDLTTQLQLFRNLTDSAYPFLPAGILLTHAHIGHYTGLMYLGREAMGARNVPVYCMPEMARFLSQNGPWKQLVEQKNILLNPMQFDDTLRLGASTAVVPVQVVHRDEFSETAGFRILAGNRRVLFIPDIDKWEKWGRNIIPEVQQSDIALLDATFYSAAELPGRRMAEVPHPFVMETMAKFESQSPATRSKVYFIHFNHTNPALWNPEIQHFIKQKGFFLAKTGGKL